MTANITHVVWLCLSVFALYNEEADAFHVGSRGVSHPQLGIQKTLLTLSSPLYMAQKTTSTDKDQSSAAAADHNNNSSLLVNEHTLLDAFEDFQSFLKRDSHHQHADVLDDVEASSSVKTTTTATPIPSTDNIAAAIAATAQPAIPKYIFDTNTFLIDTIYGVISFLYPVRGCTAPRDFTKFYVLEMVARVPYFAYLLCLHFRETFGERNLTDKMRHHYAEADNELHHLLIMEELGGNQKIMDRFLAGAICFAYFWFVMVIFTMHESAAYHLSEVIEAHATNTYESYLDKFGDQLQQLPASQVAIAYYEKENPYLLNLMDHQRPQRRKMKSLYDTFCNIRDDEREHWKGLCNLVQFGDASAKDGKFVHSSEPALSNSKEVASP